MPEVQLDSIDMKILDELSRNARLPTATLARRVNLSRNGVRQRIERLERDQVIAGYTIVSGSGRRHPVNALMMIYRKDRMRGAEVVAAIQKIPEIVFCYVVSGEADIILQVKAASQERVAAIWSEVSIMPGVVDTKTFFVLAPVVEPAEPKAI